LSSGEDITRRKQMEEALRESEEKYRLVTENVPVVVYSALPDEHSTPLLLSGRNEELTGYSAQEFKDDPGLYARTIHPDDRERVWAAIREHRRDKTPLRVEYRILTKDGAIKWVRDEATPILGPDGQVARIDGFMEDITERKRADEALHESEEKFRYVFDHSVVGKSITLPSGEMSANKALCEMLGYTADELRNKKWQDVTHPDDIELIEGALAPLFCGQENRVRFTKRYITKGGSVVWTEVSTSLRRDPEGKPRKAGSKVARPSGAGIRRTADASESRATGCSGSPRMGATGP